MKGAIIGDIVSSKQVRTDSTIESMLNSDFLSYGDCTVMTLATAYAILKKEDFVQVYRKWGIKYSHARNSTGYLNWLRHLENKGNHWKYGAALRISPIALCANNLAQAELETTYNARLTHSNHEEIEAAKATASAIFLAKVDSPKEFIKEYIELHYGYNLSTELLLENDKATLDNPVATGIAVFLHTEGFEDALMRGQTLGEADVVTSIAGAIAHAYYKDMPKFMLFNAFRVLPLELVQIMAEFNKQFTIDF
jgi:ADP-ribosylglycohydrolase